MLSVNQRTLIKAIYILIDIVCMSLAFYIACWIYESKLPFTISLENFFLAEINPYRFLFLSWVLISVLFFNSYGLYQTRREVLEGVELWLVARAVALSSFVVIVGIYITKVEGFPRSIFIVSTVLIIILLSIWRVAKRIFVQYLVISGYNNFNVLIIGAGKVGLALKEEIDTKPWLGLKVIGFLDDFKSNGQDNPDIKILGKISDFMQTAQRHFVSKVFITIHHDSGVFLQLLEQANDLGIAVRVIPQGFSLTTGEFSKYNIGLIPVLEYSGAEISRKQFGKRMFDFIISFTSILCLWWAFVIIGVIIKLNSRGPVFYVSKRYGRRGNKFNMYKFRTMSKHADQEYEKLRQQNEVDGPIFKIKNDPRITPVGRFLRKYSIDEFPQIINVLKGEMSLVGPRPLPIDQIEKEDLKQLKRLEIRPGITGLWQIRGRSDISFSRLIKWDIWYINNWSFWLDLNILFQTVPVVLKCKGAY